MTMISNSNKQCWPYWRHLLATPGTRSLPPAGLVRLVVILQGFLIVAGQNATTTIYPPYESPVHQEETKDKPFPGWLIGVIILSIMVFFVSTVTAVQRILRARNRRNDRYGFSAS